MNGQQAYKILTNMELHDPCVYRYGKRLSQISVYRFVNRGQIYFETIITTRDNDPQREESIQPWKSELEDYLCQWDDDAWVCSYTTLKELEAKGIYV